MIGDDLYGDETCEELPMLQDYERVMVIFHDDGRQSAPKATYSQHMGMLRCVYQDWVE